MARDPDHAAARPYYYAADDSAGVSTPSPLRDAGAAFSVDYSRTRAPSHRGAAASAARGAVTVNPGGPLR